LNTQSQPWRLNLYAIAVAELFALMGMTLFAPFFPLFLQELGNLDSEGAALWSGVATGAGGVALFISAPLWGMIADRSGRKPMLLRALIGGALVISLFTVAPNIYFVVGLRFLQGCLTGTVAAASALVASLAPKDKLPSSMAILMGAVFGGQTLGPLLGGYLAAAYGFTITFAVTSALLLAAGLTVLFLVKENFTPPAKGQSLSAHDLFKLAFSPELLPVLAILAVLGLGPQMISPILSLIFKAFGDSNAAAAAGEAFSLMGIITVFSSLLIGRLFGRTSLRIILMLCCIGTGLLYLPPIWANSSLQLIMLFGLTGLLTGGMIASSQSLISLRVTGARQGIAYGLGQSASSLGFGIGPFLGGGLVPLIGLKPVFGVAAGFLIFAGLLTSRAVHK
jgi:MFS transporter, DHA1 family, multidrug resistance protein